MTGYLKLRHLAEYSDLSVRTLRGLLKQGLPSYKLNGVILIRVSDFDNFMERHRVGKSPEKIAQEILHGE